MCVRGGIRRWSRADGHQLGRSEDENGRSKSQQKEESRSDNLEGGSRSAPLGIVPQLVCTRPTFSVYVQVGSAQSFSKGDDTFYSAINFALGSIRIVQTRLNGGRDPVIAGQAQKSQENGIFIASGHRDSHL